MKVLVIFVLSLVFAALFSTVDAAAAKPAATSAKAKAPVKAPAKAATSAAVKAATSAKPAAAVATASNVNGEGLPNGSPSDTGCIDGCNVYPPPAPDGNTANSLELYHLSWFPSFKAGQSLNMSFWTTYNPSPNAGAVPTTLNIDLFDQFGKVHLASVAQNVAVKVPAANSEFVLNSWAIPATVSANFNVSNQFMLVFSGANNWRRDRLVQINGVNANPGGGPNPAFGSAVTGQTPGANGTSPGGGGSGTSAAGGATPTAPSNAAAGLRSDLWMVVCVWTFLVAQVAGFMLL